MPTSARLVSLDEADAHNPALVGAKAHRLAQARARGLPVVGGLVVTAGVSEPVIGVAEGVLCSTGNSGAARSAVFNRPPPPLLDDLEARVRELGDALVVRSSSRAEAAGVWAGAFSSYVGLRPGEVVHGVIGCWASVFNPNTLLRGEMLAVAPHQVGMAVLIQPEIRPRFGGVATVEEDGSVTVGAAVGHHGPLAAGREAGYTVRVSPEGEIPGDPAPLSSRLVARIATLSRATNHRLDCRHLEWMQDEHGELFLVQAQPRAERRPENIKAHTPDPDLYQERWMNAAVRMMVRYPGPVGERLVWPWAIGSEELTIGPKARDHRPAGELARKVHRDAERLMSLRWRHTEPALVTEAWTAFRQGDAAPIAEVISRHPSVDLSLAAAQLRNLGTLEGKLAEAGVIPHRGWFWYQDPDTLDQLRPGESGPMRRVGATGWDGWMYRVIGAVGHSLPGVPAAGGWGVGRLRLIRDASDAALFRPREVIATPLPVGNIAPLLWNAAGLITLGGNPGAHLFEVAEWLAVPALCGVDIGQWIDEEGVQREEVIVALDGDRGQVYRHPHRRP